MGNTQECAPPKTRARLNPVEWPTAVAGGACALVGVLSLGGVFSPSLDALTQVAPLWFTASVVVAVATYVARARTAARLALVGVACGVILIAPPLVEAGMAPRPPRSAPDLTILQFNVWKLNRDPPGTAAWILAQNADVVALEELEGRSASIRARLEEAGYRSAGRCSKPLRCRSIVMTKREVTAGDSLAKAPDWISASFLIIRTASGPVAIAAAHTSWPWPPARAKTQIEDLSEAVTQLPGSCKIVAGDFNSSPWSFALRREQRDLNLKRRTGVTPSWPARQTTGIPFQPPLPLFPLDHVFTSECWRRSSVVTGPRLGSDHLPVLTRLWR